MTGICTEIGIWLPQAQVLIPCETPGYARVVLVPVPKGVLVRGPEPFCLWAPGIPVFPEAVWGAWGPGSIDRRARGIRTPALLVHLAREALGGDREQGG